MMKGVVFRALMGYVEDGFGPLMLERVLERAAVPRDGAYTSVGSYPVEELLALSQALNVESGVPTDEILRECGRRTMAYVIENQPPVLADGDDLARDLASLGALIQTNFIKLYPSAIVPTMTVEGSEGGWLYLLYRAPLDLADLAEGLILGALEYLQIDTTVGREELHWPEPGAARFRVKLPEK